jgi:hypothetical protein
MHPQRIQVFSEQSMNIIAVMPPSFNKKGKSPAEASLDMGGITIKVMVLQGGIEPPTSSLPMKCSTTELLQRLPWTRRLRYINHPLRLRKRPMIGVGLLTKASLHEEN